MKAPCKNCEERHLMCHDYCQKYQKFNQQQVMIRKKRLKECELACMSNQPTMRRPIRQR